MKLEIEIEGKARLLKLDGIKISFVYILQTVKHTKNMIANLVRFLTVGMI
jgi:hypothetical protein